MWRHPIFQLMVASFRLAARNGLLRILGRGTLTNPIQIMKETESAATSSFEQDSAEADGTGAALRGICSRTG
jgi:hypothetical protein